MTDVRISEITFDDISPFWLKLWSWHTPDTLERFSFMKYLGGHFNEIKDPEIAYFGAFVSDKIVGVNSIHTLPDGTCRSRGLWVEPDYRGSGIGVLLLRRCIQWSEERGFPTWSYPRDTSLKTYLAAGYAKTSEWNVSDQGIKNAFVYKKH